MDASQTLTLSRRALDPGEFIHVLVVTGGPRQGEHFAVAQAAAVIGRGEGVDIDLVDPGASRRHCSIARVAENLVVVDLQSRNGTWIDGERIRHVATLAPGSVLEVGSSLLRHEMRSVAELLGRQQLADEQARAERYVRSLLPEPLEHPRLRLGWQFLPSDRLGGDLFGYHWLDDRHLALYLFDVCGHGAAAALHSVSVVNQLRKQLLPGADFLRPETVLARLNAAFPMEDHDDMYCTMWYGVLDTREARLSFAAAGHPPALHVGPGGVTERLSARSLPIGVSPTAPYRGQQIEVRSQSRILVYSDGAFEASLPGGGEIGLDRFLSLAAGRAAAGVSGLAPLVEDLRSLTAGESFEDDVSLVLAEIV